MHLTRIIARSLPLGVVVVKPASCYLKQDLTVVTYINATHDHAGTYCMYGTKPDDLRLYLLIRLVVLQQYPSPKPLQML